MFAYNNRDYETARTCFRDAIGYDSTYAMAYFQWSHAEAFWDEAEEARRLAATAYHFFISVAAEGKRIWSRAGTSA
jgi:hypothetical protein